MMGDEGDRGRKGLVARGELARTEHKTAPLYRAGRVVPHVMDATRLLNRQV